MFRSQDVWTFVSQGADLATVITTPSAAMAIKAYSPELLVYPVRDSGLTDVLFCSIYRFLLSTQLPFWFLEHHNFTA